VLVCEAATVFILIFVPGNKQSNVSFVYTVLKKMLE
jgi:hypothetical protein